jgi:hypothetical protein
MIFAKTHPLDHFLEATFQTTAALFSWISEPTIDKLNMLGITQSTKLGNAYQKIQAILKAFRWAIAIRPLERSLPKRYSSRHHEIVRSMHRYLQWLDASSSVSAVSSSKTWNVFPRSQVRINKHTSKYVSVDPWAHAVRIFR